MSIRGENKGLFSPRYPWIVNYPRISVRSCDKLPEKIGPLKEGGDHGKENPIFNRVFSVGIFRFTSAAELLFYAACSEYIVQRIQKVGKGKEGG